MTYACLYTYLTCLSCHRNMTVQCISSDNVTLQHIHIQHLATAVHYCATLRTYIFTCLYAYMHPRHTHTLDWFLFGRTDTELYSDSLSRNLRDRNRLSHCLCVQAAADSCKLQLHDLPRCLGIPQQACEIC